MKTTGVENQKSAIVKLQEEMGVGNALSEESEGGIIESIERQERYQPHTVIDGYTAKPNIYNRIFYEGSVKVGGEVKDVSRKVYQRSDIDFEYVDPEIGISNLELMKQGKAPFGFDGEKVNLHHILQIEKGSIVELVEMTHAQYTKQLHGLLGNNPSFRRNPQLNKQFENFKYHYWKMRAENFNQLLKLEEGDIDGQ